MESGAPKTSEKQKKRNGSWDIRPYLAVGLTVILVFAICLAIFFLVFRFQGVSMGLAKVWKSLQAVLIGFGLAYLLNPIMKLFEKQFLKLVKTQVPEKLEKQKRIVRGISVAIAMLIFLAALSILIAMVVPQIISSVSELLFTMDEKLLALNNWISKLKNPTLSAALSRFVNNNSGNVVSWLEKTFFKGEDMWSSLTQGVYSAIRTFFSFIIGIIISIYVLTRKETFKGQAKKIVYAIFKPRLGNYVMEVIHKADDVFGGFFVGKIIDSIIIGIICFVVMSIMHMPYTPLISVIVGVTNIVPYFGPFIGAIPSIILILMVSPMQALYFLIFIIILQQFDGNILSPKILGDTTGLSPFWVVFAILLFGGCFGVGGMIFGVPIFALIYYIIRRIIHHVMGKRNMSGNTEDYVNLDRIDLESYEIIEHKDDKSIFRREKK